MPTPLRPHPPASPAIVSDVMPETVFQLARLFATGVWALSCVVLTACNTTIPKLQVVNFQATAADLAGQWTGTYACSQGLAGVRLSLTATGQKAVAGTFEFFPTAANAKVTPGSFSVTGTISRPGQVDFVPGAWIVRPNGSMPVRVMAAVFTNPDKLAGTVTDAGCGRFEAERVANTTTYAAPAPAAIARPDPARASVSSAGMPAATPAPAAGISTDAKPAARGPSLPSAAGALTHAQFVALLGKEKLPRLVGTTLTLNLKRGGDGGWKGYVEDPQSMVFFTCQSEGKSYAGGATVSKVRSLRNNDNGVFVVLDQCGTASATR